jgi:hypothetical protein
MLEDSEERLDGIFQSPAVPGELLTTSHYTTAGISTKSFHPLILFPPNAEDLINV